jgi:hypothetical protein
MTYSGAITLISGFSLAILVAQSLKVRHFGDVMWRI